MNDMEVIDFEKESDFLFKIPNQSNCLNLRFGPDGSILYNFVIPENTNELSVDQKRHKLGEMKTTCNEFKELLKELSSLGLQVDLNRETPISEKALIKIPRKYRHMIQKEEEKSDMVQAEKKYLRK